MTPPTMREALEKLLEFGESLEYPESADPDGNFAEACKQAHAALAREPVNNDVRKAAQAIFDKREGAFGTALIERGESELAGDLEYLRFTLKASQPRVLVEEVVTVLHTADPNGPLLTPHLIVPNAKRGDTVRVVVREEP